MILFVPNNYWFGIRIVIENNINEVNNICNSYITITIDICGCNHEIIILFA